MLLNDLTNEELLQIFTLKAVSARVKKLIEEEYRQCNDHEDDLFVIRDEAIGQYFKRKIDSMSELDESDLNEILNFKDWPSIQSVLGDNIILGKVSNALCEIVLKNFTSDDWIYNQAKSQCILNEIKHKVKETGSVGVNLVSEYFSRIISYSKGWAIYRFIEMLSCDELERLQELLNHDTQLGKKKRNVLKQEIYSIIKKNRSH